MSKTIKIQVGDITQLKVDAIVNAANASLMGGGGVDGAIHKNGGPIILEECRRIRKDHYPEGLPTGEVVLTSGGMLPARHIIHTVGPIFHQDPAPHQHLANCYNNALAMAANIGAKSIAFPGISTGVYGFPKEEAAMIAITCVQNFFREKPGPVFQVILCAFSKSDALILEEALDQYHKQG
ncbi:MAG: Appr-1-p processing domain protein [Magnetococcales bacterium]|nr:Appr-1-p processing domain protein [Magnetococcales bacterium]